MEIISKIIISMILINLIYKYIIDNNILIILVSLAIYSFITLNITFINFFLILTTITFFTVLIENLKTNSKTIYQLLNFNQTIIINKGLINYKNLQNINLTLDELLDKLKYENIDEIELCLIDKNNDITIFRDIEKTPTSLISCGKINYKNLKTIKKNEDWLNKTLKNKDLRLNEIFYAFYVENRIYFIKN